MSLKCSLCTLEFKNDDQLKQHVSGKKHRKLESMKEERERSARRSVFVSNLKKATFVKQIEEHFVQFGKIRKIVNDPKKNSYAIVEFEDEAGVEKALAAQEHKVNGKSVKISRREVKEFVGKGTGKSSEAEKKEILEKLREEALTVNKILGKCQSLDDQVEKLIAHLKLSDDEVAKRENICAELTQIFKQFWPETEFQVCTFGSTKNGLACKGSDLDLTLLLNSYLPENQHKQQVMPKIIAKQLNRSKPSSKNSSSHSNSTENEDAELVEEEVSEHADEEMSDQPGNADSGLKSCVVKFFNNKEYGELIKFDVEIQVKIVARIMQRFSRDIKSLKTITNARCPVVRFFNDALNVNCDLSMNNYLACENTKLIRLYMNLEPNLDKMIFVLRYWFKQKNLYGSSSKFNSYTIIFLVVFYMQARKIGFLPTPEHLASLADKPIEIHGWNCALETNLDKIKASRPVDYVPSSDINPSNFNDLLKGFFEFYANFSFKSVNDVHRVISTRTARVMSVSESSSQLSKVSRYVNIQDPLDLSHNLTANVSKTTLERFQTEARGSNELLHYGREPRKSNTKGWGLILLMTKKSLPISGLSEHVNSSPISVNVDAAIESVEKAQLVSNFAIYLFKECLLFEQLSQEQLNTKKRKRVQLMNQICSQVNELGIEGSKSPTKRARISAEVSSPHDENNNNSVSSELDDELSPNESSDSAARNSSIVKLGSFTLSARRNTWVGRRGVKRELKQHDPESQSELDLERMCSIQVAETNEQCSKEIDFKVDFVHDGSDGKLAMRFSLLDLLPSHLDLADFDTLVHFLHVFVNTSIEKSFAQWSA